MGLKISKIGGVKGVGLHPMIPTRRLTIPLLALAGSISIGCRDSYPPSEEQRQYIDNMLTFAEGPGLNFVTQIVQATDIVLPDADEDPADPEDVIDDIEASVNLVRAFYDAKKIYVFNGDSTNGSVGGYSSGDSISLNEAVFDSRLMYPAVLVHEGGHGIVGWVQAIAEGQLNNEHSSEVVEAIKNEGFSPDVNEMIIEDGDFPYTESMLFLIPDQVFLDTYFGIENAMNSMEQDHSDTPQSGYDYLVSQKNINASDKTTWIQYEVESIYSSPYYSGPLDTLGITEDPLTTILLTSGLWEWRNDFWTKKINAYVAQYPDEEIETVEEQQSAKKSQ